MKLYQSHNVNQMGLPTGLERRYYKFRRHHQPRSVQLGRCLNQRIPYPPRVVLYILPDDSIFRRKQVNGWDSQKGRKKVRCSLCFDIVDEDHGAAVQLFIFFFFKGFKQGSRKASRTKVKHPLSRTPRYEAINAKRKRTLIPRRKLKDKECCGKNVFSIKAKSMCIKQFEEETFLVSIFKQRKFCYLDITMCFQEAEQKATSLKSIEWDLL